MYYIELSDKRNKYLYSILKESGFAVSPLEICNLVDGFWQAGTEKSQQHSFIFSPARKFSAIEIDCLPAFITLYAGNLSEEAQQQLLKKNIKHINYMKNEEFVRENADLTAEATLSLAIQKTSKSLFETKVLILGNGRCASSIAKLFKKLELDFEIAHRMTSKTRSYIQAIIEEESPRALDIESELLGNLHRFDLIINTVPARIMSESHLLATKPHTVFIEIASVPCLDASKAKFEYIPASGLPQVYCPETAARLIYKYFIKL